MANEERSAEPRAVRDIIRSEFLAVLNAEPDEIRSRAAARKSLESEIAGMQGYREEVQESSRETGDFDTSSTDRRISEAQFKAEQELKDLPPEEH